MENLKSLADGFSLKYEKFLLACEAQEESANWDSEALDKMSTFYTGDMVSVAACLLASDGVFTENEAEFFQALFGLSYTPAELHALYMDVGGDMTGLVDNELQKGIDKLKAIHPELAGYYKELLVMVCQIIAASDRSIAPAEEAFMKRISELKV
ncbi:MAG: hypothetical protein LUE21_06195 [Oscillospiraceae bacterium]|nr:hypothetical protein [Oscillospiraceae bacterium]